MSLHKISRLILWTSEDSRQCRAAYLGASSQNQVSGLTDEHSSVLHQFFAVQEGETSEKVSDLALPALEGEEAFNMEASELLHNSRTEMKKLKACFQIS